MTVVELELLRARIPGPLHAQEYVREVAFWNADRELLLSTVVFCKAALTRGGMISRAKLSREAEVGREGAALRDGAASRLSKLASPWMIPAIPPRAAMTRRPAGPNRSRRWLRRYLRRCGIWRGGQVLGHVYLLGPPAAAFLHATGETLLRRLLSVGLAAVERNGLHVSPRENDQRCQ
jgi:hypothetical protein